jgi:hypothetical protein
MASGRAADSCTGLAARLACKLGLIALAWLVLGVASPDRGAADVAAAPQSVALLAAELSAYSGPLGPYRSGTWTTPNTICWACNQGGPATAAATLFMLTGRSQPNLLSEAVGTIDTAIATRQRTDGAFAGPWGDSQSPEIATMFFAVEEGSTYLELASVLDAARRARWQASIAAAASYLIRHGNLTWYTNGNINLGNALLFYLAWRATGAPAFSTAYEQALRFALRPPPSRWPGRGLEIVKAPTRSDGSDGAGYLTETGPGGTGFDAEYTELQLDFASRLYLVSGDPRALRLANLLVNTLLPRISSSMMLDTSHGTRHTEASRSVPVITSAFAVLGLHGGRADLVPLILPELRQLQQAYSDQWNNYGEVYRRALGLDVAVIALATAGSVPDGSGATAGPRVRAGRRHRPRGTGRPHRRAHRREAAPAG